MLTFPHAYFEKLGKSLHITTENPDKYFKHKVWHFKICLFEENYAVVFTTHLKHFTCYIQLDAPGLHKAFRHNKLRGTFPSTAINTLSLNISLIVM